MKPEAFIILTPGFPENETDSTCLPSQQLFVKLLKKQYPLLEIIVVSFQYPFASSAYDWFNCRISALGGKRKGNIFRLVLWIKAWFVLKKLRKNNNIKGLLSFWCGECALVGSRFGKRYGIQHKCWLLGQDAKAHNKYVKRIKPAGDELIAMSDFLVSAFFQNHRIRPAHIVENGIDPGSFAGDPQQRTIDILGAGSLIALKQYQVFIWVINAVKKTFPFVKAVIAGRGPEEMALRQLIDQHQLNENISLVGELPHAGVLQLMQRSKIFLHPSEYEGFGAVCIEALASGCPVISFIKPMQQHIPRWNSVQTKEEMTEKLLHLMSGPIEPNAVVPFTMQESTKKMMQLFDQ